MKQYGRIVGLVAVVIVLVLVFYVFRQASVPESTIIAREKKRVAASVDKDRIGKDEVFAADHRDKMAFLDLQQAEAFLKENKPDEAAAVLRKLIADEQGKSKGPIPRRSASYLQEARYFEVLQRVYMQKHDDAGAERAAEQRNQITARAETLRRSERLGEGRSVGVNGE